MASLRNAVFFSMYQLEKRHALLRLKVFQYVPTRKTTRFIEAEGVIGPGLFVLNDVPLPP